MSFDSITLFLHHNSIFIHFHEKFINEIFNYAPSMGYTNKLKNNWQLAEPRLACTPAIQFSRYEIATPGTN